MTSIYVLQNYSYKNAGNALDLGVFDPHGTSAINSLTGFSGSRGWSGGFRSNFTISASDATPGYNAGPLLPGTWNVVLGPYASNRSGIDWTLDISLSYTPNNTLWSPSNAPTNKGPLATPIWLRGDFHAHSIYSDGRYLPSEQIRNALSQDLDFMFFSEHNTDSGNQNVGRWIPPDASDLLIGRAIEVTTRHGHWQAIGLDRTQQVEWRYTNLSTPSSPYSDFVSAAQQVRDSGALVSVNHPFQNCSRCDWTFPWDTSLPVIDSIEVWNGRFDPLDEVAVGFWQEQLVQGKRITAIGGSDAHSPPDMIGIPTTVVRVEGSKSQEAVVQGVRAGKVYVVEGRGMEVSFGVEYLNKGCEGRAEMGDVLPGAEMGGDAKAVFVGNGFERRAAKLCWISEQGYFRNDSVADGQRMEQGVEGLRFIRVEVRNETDALLGLTNPIYLA